MSGNLFECCWDWYDENFYSDSLSNNPKGPSSGYSRVFRGGSFYRPAVPTTFRGYNGPSGKVQGSPVTDYGFRLVRTAE